MVDTREDLLFQLMRRHSTGSLGLDDDPELAFAGIQALRSMADFCETYPVGRLRERRRSWAQIAVWAGVTPQALHKRHARRHNS